MWGPTHLDLPTNTHSQYLQENISLKAHKHIHRGHHDQQDSKPGKSRRPIPESSIKPQNPPSATLAWVHSKTGITSTWLQWPAKCTPVKSTGRFTDGTKQHNWWGNPFLGRRPGEILLSSAGQTRKSCCQSKPSKSQHYSTPYSQITDITNYVVTQGAFFKHTLYYWQHKLPIRKICFWGED